MRRLVMVWMLCAAAPAWCATDILEVLQRSQQRQLEALQAAGVPASDPASRRIHDSFERVASMTDAPPDLRLVVTHGPVLAVCLMGHVIAVNASLADLPESERLFVLAHELGHVQNGHWDQLGRLYKQYIPGDVVQEQTDAVAIALSREASALAHQQEFSADAFALRLLRRMGQGEDGPLALFRHLPSVSDTVTHPSTMQRVANLQRLQ